MAIRNNRSPASGYATLAALTASQWGLRKETVIVDCMGGLESIDRPLPRSAQPCRAHSWETKLGAASEFGPPSGGMPTIWQAIKRLAPTVYNHCCSGACARP